MCDFYQYSLGHLSCVDLFLKLYSYSKEFSEKKGYNNNKGFQEKQCW